MQDNVLYSVPVNIFIDFIFNLGSSFLSKDAYKSVKSRQALSDDHLAGVDTAENGAGRVTYSSDHS